MSATTNLKGITKIKDVLEAANLHFVCEQAEVINSVTGTVSERAKMLYRSDTKQELGIVGCNYQPVQNFEAFSFFDTVCEQYNASYNKIISIENGTKIIVEARMNEPVIIAGDETLETFTLINSFDGSSPCSAFFGAYRLVCSNGLRAHVTSAHNHFRIRHTKNVHSKIEQAVRIIAAEQKYFEIFKERCEQLAQIAIDKNMVEKFLETVIGEAKNKQTKNRHAEISQLFEHGKGNKGETAWDLYNGLTEYVDHYYSDESSEDRMLVNRNIGQGVKWKEQGFAWLSELATVN